jgi:hypothetical protein
MQLCRQKSNQKSVSKRALSSIKFSRPITARESSEITFANKTSILKLASAREKQIKINNFFDNLTNILSQPMPGRGKKKQQTVKVQLKNKY